MSKDGDRIRELIEVERDLKSTPRKKEMVVTIQLQPIEFNVFIGNKPPTRDEVGRAIIQLIENDNYYYEEIIKHVKEQDDE